MDVDWDGEGLGLAYGTVVVEPVRAGWGEVGRVVVAWVGATVASVDPSIEVEHVGSTSVEGILAKPVIDLAVGVTDAVDRGALTDALVDAGFLFRGDAGEDGGLLFMLESRPSVRVVHAHVVELGGRQWRDYLALRSVLRASADAREAYGRVKVDLATAAPEDPRGYTDGKTEVVRRLLGSA